MTVYIPAQIKRKKQVHGKYNPDTYRVISTEAENAHCNFQPVFYGASFEPPDEELCHNNGISCQLTRVMPKPLPDYRFNKPHSKLCTFIRTNVLLFNDPICQVLTRKPEACQVEWCVNRPQCQKSHCGEHSHDTVYKDDYRYNANISPLPRLKHRPDDVPGRNIVPVTNVKDTDEHQRCFRERMSFEHHYNSRTNPNYPIRSKRIGSFVYDKVSCDKAYKLIDQSNT